MSWLRRTGNGRNNIAWGGGSTTTGNYLRRTGTSRNSIQWLNISSNGTYNILERTNNTNRNSIRWINTTFNFKSDYQIRVEEMFAPVIENGYTFHMIVTEGSGISDQYKSTECKLNDTGSSYTFTVIDYDTKTILTSAYGYFEIYTNSRDETQSLKSHFSKFIGDSYYYIKTYHYQNYNDQPGYITENLIIWGVDQNSDNCRISLTKPSEYPSKTYRLYIDNKTIFYYK